MANDDVIATLGDVQRFEVAEEPELVLTVPKVRHAVDAKASAAEEIEYIAAAAAG